jgi:hypothetical protein
MKAIILNIIMPAIISAVIALLTFIIKQNYEEKDKIKTSARLLHYDIIRLINIITEIEKEKTLIPSYDFSILNNWLDLFTIVNVKLENEYAWTIFEFYSRIEVLKRSQEEFVVALNTWIKTEFTAGQEMQSLNMVANTVKLKAQEARSLGDLKGALDRLDQISK